MKNLLTITTLYLLLSMSQAWSLPTCSGSPQTGGSIYWDNCIGTYIWADGNKYVGEWKDNKFHGQGTYTWDNGRWVGLWKNNKWVSGKQYAAGEDQRIQDQKEAKRKKELAEAEAKIRKLKAEREANKFATLEKNKIFKFAKEEEKLGNYNEAIKLYQQCYPSDIRCREQLSILRNQLKNTDKEDDKNKITTKNVSQKNIDKKTIFSVQKILIIIGYKLGNPDGVIGTQTLKAIKEYQKAENMNQTGIIDNNLIISLLKVEEELKKQKRKQKEDALVKQRTLELENELKQNKLRLKAEEELKKQKEDALVKQLILELENELKAEEELKKQKEDALVKQRTLELKAAGEYNPSSQVSSLPPCAGSNWNSCYGTYTFANGDIYVGEWKDDKSHGQGTSTYPNGDKYVGEFKDGSRNGQGTITYANGEKYVGEWKDGDCQDCQMITK